MHDVRLSSLEYLQTLSSSDLLMQSVVSVSLRIEVFKSVQSEQWIVRYYIYVLQFSRPCTLASITAVLLMSESEAWHRMKNMIERSKQLKLSSAGSSHLLYHDN